jgi:RNA polymerase sigma-70 factor, ECF subfamily
MMNHAEGSDAAHVAGTLAGDKEAFRVLVERYGHRIFRLAYRLSSCEQDAEDLVQETFLRAYRNLARFESRSNFGTWLYRICVNCSLDQKRKLDPMRDSRIIEDEENNLTPAALVSPVPNPERLVLSAELKGHVDAALDSLTSRERAAFVLRHFEGLSIEEIARILGLREASTKNTIFRGVQKMRRALQPVTSVIR